VETAYKRSSFFLNAIQKAKKSYLYYLSGFGVLFFKRLKTLLHIKIDELIRFILKKVK